jgi:hypothetical protein
MQRDRLNMFTTYSGNSSSLGNSLDDGEVKEAIKLLDRNSSGEDFVPHWSSHLSHIVMSTVVHSSLALTHGFHFLMLCSALLCSALLCSALLCSALLPYTSLSWQLCTLVCGVADLTCRNWYAISIGIVA